MVTRLNGVVNKMDCAMTASKKKVILIGRGQACGICEILAINLCKFVSTRSVRYLLKYGYG